MSYKSVLVIEDDFSIRETLKITLEIEGWSVTTAANGQEGLELLRGGNRFAIILLDLMMPVMSGFEFLEIRATSPHLSSIPVIVVSAFPTDIQTLPVQEFVKKPINLQELLQIMHRWYTQEANSLEL